MSGEKRKYRRITVSAFIRFYEGPIDLPEPAYHQGVIKNYSKGGMCISATRSLPEGCAVTIEIPITPETLELKIVQVCGIVRWVEALSERWLMGVEFFELRESEHKNLHEWLATLIS